MSDHDVKGTCHQCGSAEFGIFYDPVAQGHYVQCPCGSVIGGVTLPSVDVPVCGRCRLPAEFRDGAWKHAETADGAFCSIVMGGGPGD